MSELSLSYLKNIPPQEASEPTKKHLIIIHITPQPVQTLEKYEGYHNEGLARPGDINLISAGETTYCRWDAPLTFLRLDLSPQFVRQVATQTDLVNPAGLEIIQKFRHRDTKILQISQWLLDETQNNNPGGKLYTDSLTNVLTIHLLQNYTVRPPDKRLLAGQLSQPQVARAVEYMRANLEQDISLEELAGITSTSPTYLVRLFKNSYWLSTTSIPHKSASTKG